MGDSAALHQKVTDLSGCSGVSGQVFSIPLCAGSSPLSSLSVSVPDIQSLQNLNMLFADAGDTFLSPGRKMKTKALKCSSATFRSAIQNRNQPGKLESQQCLWVPHSPLALPVRLPLILLRHGLTEHSQMKHASLQESRPCFEAVQAVLYIPYTEDDDTESLGRGWGMATTVNSVLTLLLALG